MGIDVMEIGVHLRKFLILSIRISYRSTHKHPLIVGFVLFSLLLYRFLPFLFVFLVSSSPVLVCTFALLGTLLSYGQHPNIPQIDEEQEEDDENTIKPTHHEHEVSSLKTGVLQSDLVVQKDEEEEEEEEEKDGVFSLSRAFDDGLITEKTSLIENESTHIQYQLVEEEREFLNQEKREFYDVQKREFHELKPLIEVDYSAKDDDAQEVASTSYARSTEIEPLISLEEESNQENYTHGLLPPNLGDSSGSNQDSLSLWKKIKDRDDGDDDEDDESYNSDSDGAESSSPDASITDIMPMLDELHPLLDTETPRRDAHVSSLDDEFDAASDRPHNSNDDHVESGEEDEHHEDEEDDDDEEEDEEEGQCETPEGETKAVLKWTEDDEKNLMDLGNSELERNQRLESLIARRRARKNFRMIESEKNMIDLDFSGPPFQIAPISTARRNPFDLHYDSYMGLGLPPMPGSAPSVMLPRRNPFDLPYDDPLEERPDLTGGNFGEEFMTAHEKDMHYRRCESFNMGAFFFNDHRHDKHHVSKFRPYFVTEQMASEGLGYSRFSRQMSEASESKMSFASETESHSTVANQEDISNLVEEQLSSHQEDISSLVEEQISSHESEINPSVEHTPGRVKLESEPSKEVHLDSDSDKEGKDDVDLIKVEDESDDAKTSHGTQSRFYSEFIALEEHLTSYVHVNQEVGEEQQHTRSSSLSSSGVREKIEENSEDEESSHGTHSSYVHVDQDMGEHHQQHTRSNSHSSSDMHEKIFDVNVDEELSDLDLARGDAHEHFSNFMQPTVVDSDLLTRVEGEDDSHTEAPVYDLSPSASRRDISDMMSFEETVSYKDNMVFVSTSSVSSDMHVEVPEPVVVEGITSLADREASVQIGTPRKLTTPGYEKSWEPSVELCVIDENEPEKEGLPCEEASLQFIKDQSPSSSFDPKTTAGVLQSDKDGKVDTLDLPYSDEMPSRDIALSELKDQLVQPSSNVHHEESQGSSILSDILAMEAGAVQEVGGPLVDEQQEDDVSNLPPFLSAPTSPPSLVDEQQEDDVSNLLPFLSAPTSPPSEFVEYQLHQMVFEDDSHEYESKFDFNQESIGYHEANDQFDEEEPSGVEEINEEFLTELDAVGDFSFDEKKTDANQDYEQLASNAYETLTGLQVLESKSSKGAEDKFEALKLVSVDDVDSEIEQFPERVAPKHVDVTEEIEVLSAESIKQPHNEPISEVKEDENAEFKLHTQDKNLTDLNLELLVLEARSIEDIDSAFRHLHETEAKKSFVLDRGFGESVLEETEVESTESCKQRAERQTEGIKRELVEFALPTQEQILTSTTMDFTVLEARSFEDIDSAFKQLQEGEAKNSILPEVLDESPREAKLEPAHSSDHEPILKETKDGQAVFALPVEEPRLIESNLEAPILEVRSFEDFGDVLEQLHKGDDAGTSIVDEPVLKKSTVASAESFGHVLDEPVLKGTEDEHAVLELAVEEPKLIESNLESPIPQARSFEDLDAFLEQLHEGDDAETSIVDEPELKKSIVASAESFDHVLDEPLLTGLGELTHTQERHLIETDLELLAIEARSVENVDAVLEQIHEGDNLETFIIDEPGLKKSVVASTESSDHVLDEPMLMETEDGLDKLKLHAQERNLTEADLELPVIEARSVEDVDAVLKQLHEGDNLEASIFNKPVLKESTVASAKTSDHVLDEPLLMETKDELGELTVHTQERLLTETDLEIPVIEARSFEDVDAVLKQLHEGDSSGTSIANEPELKESAVASAESFDHVLDDPLLLETKDRHGELALDTQKRHLTETDLELPVIEARSVEDVEAVFKQLREGDNSEAFIVNKSVSKVSTAASAKSSDHVVDEPLLMETEDELGELTVHTLERLLTETDLELPVIEARSVEDVDAVLKQLHQGDNSEASIVNKPVLKESTVASARTSDHVLDEPLLMETKDELGELTVHTQERLLTETDLEIPVIEARSVEDVDAVLKQLHEGDCSGTSIVNEPELKESAVASAESFDHVLGDPLLLETKDRQGEFVLDTQKGRLTETDLELPVIDARSVEDVDAVFKQLCEGDNSEAFIVNKLVPKVSTVSSAKSSDHVVDEPLLMETEEGQGELTLHKQ
ncbi:hypothetical protein MKX01_001586 [Papaver californicum]|nr:hypothetical protein MKX01_001586 [Papaver californicum]